ncbi:VIP36-like protein [Porphyridium purpureum]|uniref:VIP36-like protein n=1 Tax=Porphyridium purpureum TaxID=35688 RepID=A0A5J4ZA84_PORPP|nr:VIP36-like protein [Porphyridium purpureum]|eukprot:POR6816..scf295_1
MERRREALRASAVLMVLCVLLVQRHATVVLAGGRKTIFPVMTDGDVRRTFQHPFEPDGISSPIKHFNLHGSATVSKQDVRGDVRDVVVLTADRKSNRGLITGVWQASSLEFDAIIDVEIRKTVADGSPRADGLAFWFLKDTPFVGPVYGINEKFTGLGVIIDTYSNSQRHKHPYVFAWLNDGTVEWDDASDGHGVELAPGCEIDRVRLDLPTRVFIQYKKGTLKVAFSVGHFYAWKDCFTIDNFDLPFFEGDGGVFAVSASTGTFSAEHVVSKLSINQRTDKNMKVLAPAEKPNRVASQENLDAERAYKDVIEEDDVQGGGLGGARVSEEELDELSETINKMEKEVEVDLDMLALGLTGDTLDRVNNLRKMLSSIFMETSAGSKSLRTVSRLGRTVDGVMHDVGSIHDELQDEFEALHMRMGEVKELMRSLQAANSDLHGTVTHLRLTTEKHESSRTIGRAPIVVFVTLTQCCLALLLLYYKRTQQGLLFSLPGASRKAGGIPF